MLRRLPLLAVAALSLAACDGEKAAQKGAAESATRLLTAAFADDRAAFEREIDRPAVRSDVRRQMTEFAKATALDVEGGPSDFALDRMIGPSAVTLVNGAGEALTVAPTPAQVAVLMKAVDDRHACLRDAESPGKCLLTFGKGRGGWRLVGMRAMNLRVQVADAGP